MINFSELVWKGASAVKESASVRDIPAPPERVSETGLSRVPVAEAHVDASSRIALLSEPRGPGADRFRYLRMRLREVRSATNLKSMVITSPLPRDGKSTMALNLATTLADGGKQTVVLVEADLHRPTLAQSLGIAPRAGLAEHLEDDLELTPLLQRVEPLAWYLLQAGTARGNPSELLQTDSISAVVEKLSSLFDWVIFDTPPVGPLTDAISLSRAVDASMLVVRADATPRSAVDDAISRLGKNHILGVIFNGSEGVNRSYSSYYGHYGKK